MENLESINFNSVNQLKHFIDKQVLIEINDEVKLFKINSQKINWEYIDNLSDYFLLKEEVILENILDKKVFNESVFTKGFIDVSVKLSKIGRIRDIEHI